MPANVECRQAADLVLSCECRQAAGLVLSCESCHEGDPFFLLLWNQKGADSGAFLFAGKARSYKMCIR